MLFSHGLVTASIFYKCKARLEDFGRENSLSYNPLVHGANPCCPTLVTDFSRLRLRVVVGVKGGTLTKIEETGETSNLRFDTGLAYWLTEDPPGKLHGDINESDQLIEVMVIKLKALDKNTHSESP